MTEAYLSRLILEPRSREVQRDLADIQKLHRRVMSGFPDHDSETARRAFGVLFRIESGPQGVTLLVQSKCEPQWGKLPGGYLATDWLGGGPSIAMTTMAGIFARCHVGEEFRFRFKANPTRCIESKTGPDGKRRGKKVPLRKESSRLDWLIGKILSRTQQKTM